MLRLIRSVNWKIILCLVLVMSFFRSTAALAGQSEPGEGNPAQPGNSCLFLEGSSDEVNTKVELDEGVTLTYKLKPSGEFTETVRAPINLALALDYSGSMYFSMERQGYPPNGSGEVQRFTVMKNATNTLLKNVKDYGANDKLGILFFNETATLKHDLTTDYEKLKQIVSDMSPSGGTNIEHALRLAGQILKGDKEKENYVILVTDGAATNYEGDNGSSDPKIATEKARLAADSLKARSIVVYTIALGKPGTDEVDHELLEYIADKTGGQKFDATSQEKLEEIFKTITEVLIKPTELKSIRIIQPLPEGFELAGDYGDHIRIENGKLYIDVDAIPYPYTTEEIKIELAIKQTTAPGSYELEDAHLDYVNACDQAESSNIHMNYNITVLGGDLFPSTPNIQFENSDAMNGKARPDHDREIKVTASDDIYHIEHTEITIDGKTVPLTNADEIGKSVVYKFPLSQAISDKQARKGWHHMHVNTRNANNDRNEAHFYFLINPGPSGKISKNSTDNQSNKPVLVTVDFENIIVPKEVFTTPGATPDDGKAVKVKTVKYLISPTPISMIQNEPDSKFKKLGSKKFTISSSGSNYVYVKIVDDFDNAFYPDPVKVNINYDQRRY